MKKIVIAGAGPHSKVIIDLFEQTGEYEIVGLTDSREGNVLGYPILGTDQILQQLYEEGVEYAFAAVGNNRIRERLYQNLETIGFQIPSVVSPCAVVSRYTGIGSGTAVMPGAVINAGAKIGCGAIINTKASVDHDCCIGDFVHIAPGCALSGSTTIGTGSFLGTGCSVIDGIHIGDRTVIGAGTVVIHDLPASCKAVGVPARVISDKANGEN